MLVFVLFLVGLVWHQDLTKIFVSYRVEANREEAAENAGLLISHRGACALALKTACLHFAWRVSWDIGAQNAMFP